MSLSITASTWTSTASAQEQRAGSIRGSVSDQDFDSPLDGAKVRVVEPGLEVETDARGNFVVRVPPGTYTVVVSKSGYTKFVRTGVVVTAGRLTDLSAALTGDFTEMEEFVVETLTELAGGTEEILLDLRLENASFLDFIGQKQLAASGVSDAGEALPLVAGATVQDGRFAVVRGLPDRYVSSQLNGIRLPSADQETRAVELDQFPSSVLESIQVSKTFTPDQQGDASGGAVDVRLRGIPEDPFFFSFRAQNGYNSNIGLTRDDFLSYDGGGVNYAGSDGGARDPQLDSLDDNWTGAAGVDERSAPIDFKWSVATGGNYTFDNGVKVGAMASFFYERDSAFTRGIEDNLWIEGPGEQLTPQTTGNDGGPVPIGDQLGGDFQTSLFEITRAREQVQWGTLLAAGLEWEEQSIDVVFLHTRTVQDEVTLAEDTRGKQTFFPGYDPNDPTGPGNRPDEQLAAPYIRTQSLDYNERTLESLILSGDHTLPVGEWWVFREPVFDWTYAESSAELDQPDNRLFGAIWLADSFVPGTPFQPAQDVPARFERFVPAATFSLGNFQRIFETIDEESDTYALNLKFPFEQWSGVEGYLKVGLFEDAVDREFDQETFSNFGDQSRFEADFSQRWTDVFPLQDHPISESDFDIDYSGQQDIAAYYAMLELPLSENFRLVGGVRVESTDIDVQVSPDEEALFFAPGSAAGVEFSPGAADVDFSEDETLPAVGFVYTPFEHWSFRGSYSKTLARQTFRELTPILQQEFLGGPAFVGNPLLTQSQLENFDLRVDYTPYAGSLLSASYFLKNLDDPIELIQRVGNFEFTTPVNYPDGELEGYEFELRQHLGDLSPVFDGLTIGGNATFIDSEVTFPADDQGLFDRFGSPRRTRDASNAPERLFNLNLTYDVQDWGTQFGLFYTVTGDTLVAGAGLSENNLIPDVYAKEFENLNLTVTQRISDHVFVQFKAKNLTNPRIEREYRPLDGDPALASSFDRGIDYSLTFGGRVTF